jgi:UDP-N-acetylmuramate: L-alanyl-gamma-D-glutamyl-meso-diaminopimelate ligase
MPYDYCSMILREGAHIHLIAACGTAMGSLAAMLCELGYRVTGSDSQVYPPMSTFLAQAGIHLFTGFDSTHLDEQPDLVIVGNAVSRGNVELEATLERRIPYSCLPEVLRDLFIRDRQSVVITGTHGKTTTTAMTAHLFTSGDLDPSFLVAGLVKNFDRPYRLGHGKHFIIEGDEYDSAYFAKWAKFFFYLPEVLIINNIEFDHADIYKDLSEIEKAFRQVVNMVPCSGLILANSADEVVTNLLPLSLAPVQTFGLEQHSFWRADIISSTPAGTGFTLHCQDRPLGNFHLSMHGEYNVRNATASLAAGYWAGLSVDTMRTSLAQFKGVRRRQELIGQVDNILLIDDFAHHPTAVGKTLQAIAQTYPERRLWAIFEPASATNARALFEEHYLAAFAPASYIVIAAVPHPERARDDAPFSPERLIERLRVQGKHAWYIATGDLIVTHLMDRVQSGDLVLFMSNGGFAGIQQKLLNTLSKNT